jgi:hypothetical protein
VSVFFRTGANSAASVSWPVYLFLVLPLQLLYGFFKLAVIAAKWLAIAVAAVAAFTVRTGRDWRRRHEENRPPAA